MLRSTKQLQVARVKKIRADHHADTVSCCHDFTMTNFMRYSERCGALRFFQSWVLLCQESWLLLHTSQEDLQIIFRPEKILLSLLCLWDKNVVVSVFMNILLWLKKELNIRLFIQGIAQQMFCFVVIFLIVFDHPCSHRLKWFQFTDNRCFLETVKQSVFYSGFSLDLSEV